jgi:hypothetical protein
MGSGLRSGDDFDSRLVKIKTRSILKKNTSAANTYNAELPEKY